MRKSAKIGVIVSVLAVITLLVVLSSTIFAVGQARLIWYNVPTGTLANLTNEMILENSNVAHQSVFILDKQKAKESLEAKYPRMRVIDIEVVWPNIINVHAIERQEVYAVKLGENKYAITDEYFKILKISNTFSSTQTNQVLVEIPNLNDKNYNVGDTISFEYTDTFINIYQAFLQLNRDLTDMRALCASISYTNSKVTINTHFGVTILLDNPTINTAPKMRLAIKVFDMLGTEDYGKGTIEVFVNSDNDLESRYY